MRSLPHRWFRPILVLAATALIATAPGMGAAPPLLAWEAALYGSGEGELRWPVDVASAAEGELVVADVQPPRLVVFREAADGSWNSARVVELPQPPAALTASGGRYLLTLRGSGGLFAVSRDEWKPQRIPLPTGVVAGDVDGLSPGGAYVQDLLTGEILQVDEGGRVVARIASSRDVTAISASFAGTLFALDPVAAEIRPLGPGATGLGVRSVPGEVGDPAWPADIAATSAGDLYVLDRHRGRVILLDGTGQVVGVGAREGLEPGLLSYPAALCVMPDGRIAVADQNNGRAQVFHRIEDDGS